jgi:hypothetical protein
VFGEDVCLIPSSSFGFSLNNPVMGGFQGTSVTALPSATDDFRVEFPEKAL